MGLFDIFKKKKTELTEEQLKWNKMWDLWTDEKIQSPYAELMTYQSEVNNGGHSQFFINMENVSDLEKVMAKLDEILPLKLRDNLKVAYKLYLVLERNEDDENAEEVIENCDDIFFENEEEINNILEDFANSIEL